MRAYRGGYLPIERRQIESQLFSGKLRGVAATNALELGVDIGSLDVVVMAGYPGAIASTWQRAGRAGRRQSASVAVLVASSAPLDQYIIEHPDYFFGQSPEHAYINPNNLELLLSHLKCAAFELPLRDGEKFGPHETADMCHFLAELGFLHHSGTAWHWTSDSYPADAVSLRAATSDNFVVIDTTGENKVIGVVSFPVALTSLTTAIGFLTLNFSDSPPFRDLGNIVAAGMIAAFFYAVVFLPAMMAVLPVRAAVRGHGRVGRGVPGGALDRPVGATRVHRGGARLRPAVAPRSCPSPAGDSSSDCASKSSARSRCRFTSTCCSATWLT